MSQDHPPVTRWSLVARAAGQHEEGLNELLSLYHPVLTGMLRRWPNIDPATGEDLVQSFLQKRVLEKGLLEKVDPARGRFRSFLFKAFQYHILDELRKASAARRSPGEGNLLPYEDLEPVLGKASDMEQAFHVAWVRHLVEEACRRMEDQCRTNGKMDTWLVFEARMKTPLLDGDPPLPYEQLISSLKIQSPTQAANLLITGKRMLRRILEDLIRETVEDPEDIAEELAFLKQGLE